MTTETNVVSVKNLNVYYGKLHAVRGISFEIPKGEVFGFIGPNGAGKSSTIRVLATLQKKFSGQVCVNGIEVRENPDRIREMIGFMPDFFGVYEDLTAREYLHFFAAAYRLPKDRRHSTVSDVLELTDLSHKIDSPVDSLSRGMKQRLALARVLLHDPDLLLLDEPASGLDPRARIEVRELLKAMQEMGKTILISSHILHELAQLCTRIGIIEAGQLVAEGSLNEIFQQLSLKRVVHVQIVKLSDEVLKEMEQIPGIDSIERHTDRVAIRLREDELAVEDLHSELVRLGCKIRMFQPEAMDMETAFMKLTEGVTA
ncbi:ABC transporter ATP-binding protein [Thalassoglobus sp. JC818]|uniref:ABC transporter ATP-binding protein n=1 Tax=Thalassoglobus sp. JC818 TaxID=3232136 RepID=UPI003458DB40